MKPVVFLPEAEQEMLEAAIYYHSKASGLAADYLSEVERAAQSVRESPDTWPLLKEGLEDALSGDSRLAFYTGLNLKKSLLLL